MTVNNGDYKKMRNKLGFLITVLSVFLILTACGNVTGNDENRLSNDPYEILLYKYGEGAAPQVSTEKYNGKELITSNKTTKTKTENKKSRFSAMSTSCFIHILWNSAAMTAYMMNTTPKTVCLCLMKRRKESCHTTVIQIKREMIINLP